MRTGNVEIGFDVGMELDGPEAGLKPGPELLDVNINDKECWVSSALIRDPVARAVLTGCSLGEEVPVGDREIIAAGDRLCVD